MLMNRRTLLKVLGIAPAISLFQSPFASAMVFDEGTPYSAYILLHGLFFLEFALAPDGKTPGLYAATPVHSPHQFYTRYHNQNFNPLQGTIDLTQGQLKPGSVDVFPTELPQFPRRLLDPSNKDNPVLPGAQIFQCKLILPQPKSFFAYRSDTKANFVPDQSSSIGAAVFNSVGPRVATITCLEYDPGTVSPYVESYYAEHCLKASSAGVNDALAAAASLLGAKFNLKILPSIVPDATEDANNTLPPGVTQADENEFREFREIRPPGCITNSVSAEPSKSAKTEKVIKMFASDIASCPQFGMPGG